MKTFKWLMALVIMSMGHFLVSAQQTEYGGLKWYLDYQQARKVALHSHKPIIILFTGSDWCPPCMALKKEVLPNRLFQEKAKHVVLVLADFPKRKPMDPMQKQKNRALAGRFLGQNGLPTMVAVDPKTETVMGHITGYNFYTHDISPHIRFIERMIQSKE
jgi:thioredoxin-related protein